LAGLDDAIVDLRGRSAVRTLDVETLTRRAWRSSAADPGPALVWALRSRSANSRTKRSALRQTCARDGLAKGPSEDYLHVAALAALRPARASELESDDVVLGLCDEQSSSEVGLIEPQQLRVALVPRSRVQIRAERGDRSLFGGWSDLRPHRRRAPDRLL
jgi:hypothetical protein